MSLHQCFKEHKKRTIVILSLILISIVYWEGFLNFGQIALTLAQYGNYTLFASTVVNGDRVELWKQPTDDPYFWTFLIVAISDDDQHLAFTVGQFTSSSRAFYQNNRYMALAASNLLSNNETFFIYDAKEHRFLRRTVSAHIHEGCVIVDDHIYFSSCKTPQPVFMLDIPTANMTAFSSPAPQGAAFYVVDSKILVMGTGNNVYEIIDRGLSPSMIDLSARTPTAMNFDSIRIMSP